MTYSHASGQQPEGSHQFDEWRRQNDLLALLALDWFETELSRREELTIGYEWPRTAVMPTTKRL
jgi:hypothetical protein